jgi:hypothetical protein
MDKPARSPLARSFERHMRAQNRSQRTITTYLMGLRQAETFLRERPDRARCTDERERAAIHPTTLEMATRADLEAFMADVLARRAPSTAATYYKVLKVLYAWLHSAVQIRGICRDLADLAERIEGRGQAEPEVLIALGRLLVELGGGVAAFGQLVAPDVAGPPREAVPLQIALEVARTHRDVLAELMLVDARADPELWHIQGSLLANVDRLLREIDLERGPDARRVRRR